MIYSKKNIILFVITAVVAFLFGIILHMYTNKKIEIADLEQINMINDKIEEQSENKIVVEVSSRSDKTKPSTELVYETYYTKCGHLVSENKKLPNELINKNEEEIEKAFADWTLKNYTSDTIELYREKNEFCQNHYIVRERDGKIIINKINANGEESFYKETDIIAKYLTNDDLKLLKNGIKADNEEELNKIISDYEN